MSEFKGTKGNWKIKHSQSKSAYNVIGTTLGGRYKIAKCLYIIESELSSQWNDKEVDEAKANAVLISKAPEMLEAMQEFCDRVDNGEIRSTKTYYKFKEIIKSATKI